MIDIHSHVIPNIDDGSASIEQSLAIIDSAINNGVTDLICTPHFRAPYICPVEKVRESFEQLKKSAKERNKNINLYLGQEIFVTPSILDDLKSGRALTLNDTNYILLEFDYDVYMDIVSIVRKLIDNGYIPIIAHPERYRYVDVETLRQIKSLGGLIQINTNSIVGNRIKIFYKIVKQYLKEDVVDFVASDAHFTRESTLYKAYEHVGKKFNKVQAEKLFNINACKIIAKD